MATNAPELLADDIIAKTEDGKFVCKVCVEKNVTPNTFDTKRGAGIHKAQMHTAAGRKQRNRRRAHAQPASGNGNGKAALSELSISFPRPVARITIDGDKLLKGYDLKGKLVAAQILAEQN